MFKKLFLLLLVLTSSLAFSTLDHSFSSAHEPLCKSCGRPLWQPRVSNDAALAPFLHGVASGDPLHDRVIIWTRITPDGMETPVTLDVKWQVYNDVDLQNLVQEGTFTTSAERDWTVKVDITNLTDHTTYYYVFTAPDGRKSLIGRTRTTPLTTPKNDAEKLRFALASCSSIYSGYFNAYARIAERNDLDAVIHVGDYLYDFVDADEQVRATTDEVAVPTNLTEWRERHAYYRLDADLRAAHQQHPWIIIWDNHDVPDGEDFEVQAFFEWIPLREPDQSNGVQVHRTLPFGDLVDVIMIDVQFHTNPRGGGQKVCEDGASALDDPARTRLGFQQETWLENELLASKQRGTTWRVLGNQKLMGIWKAGDLPDLVEGNPVLEPILGDIMEEIGISVCDNGVVLNANSWDGYPEARKRLFNYMRENQIYNNITLTGDMHFMHLLDLHEDPFNASRYTPATGGDCVGVEFLAAGISRGNVDEMFAGDDTPGEALRPITLVGNPHFRDVEYNRSGYGIIDITAERAVMEMWFSEILEPTDQETFYLAYQTTPNNNVDDIINNDPRSNHLETTPILEPITEDPNAPVGAPATPPQSDALPLNLLTFTASAKANTTILDWETSSELNSKGFEIQQHEDDRFVKIGYVDAIGYALQKQQYQFKVSSLKPGWQHFRLKMLDQDGNYTYSPIANVRIVKEDAFTLSPIIPNPAGTSTSFSILVGRDQQVNLLLFDASGKLLRTIYQGVLTDEGQHDFSISTTALPTGTYYLKVKGTYFEQTKTLQVK